MKKNSGYLLLLLCAFFLFGGMHCKKKGTDPKPTAPTAPSNLVANATCTPTALLSWQDNAGDETGFRIERAQTGGFVTIDSVAANVVNYVDVAISAPNAYQYRVQAYNSVGSSAYSNVDSINTATVTTTAPTNLTASVDCDTNVTLNWTDNANNELGFQIERSSGGIFAVVDSVGANITTFYDTSVDSAKTYLYRVKAYTCNTISGTSNTKSINTAFVPTNIPTNLFGFADCVGKVALNWDDNSLNEAGFTIERANGGSFTVLDSVGPNVTTYADSGLTMSTTYQYRVRAFTCNFLSPSTNTISLMTPSGSTGAAQKVYAPNGLWYRKSLTGSSYMPELVFQVTDNANAPLSGYTIALSKLTGDGALTADSVMLNASCNAPAGYSFSGALGYASLSASVSGLDSAIVNLRANMLQAGASFQGQYILSTDQYRNVVGLNGPPATVDVDPNFWITYANYETAKGVVVVIDDGNHTSTADSAEQVLGIIVNSVYKGTTATGVGIGSSMSAVRATFGNPSSIQYDPTPPPAILISYSSLGMTLYGTTADTTIFEIHLFAPATTLTATLEPKEGRPQLTTGSSRYRTIQ